jgi:hypothetical protein
MAHVSVTTLRAAIGILVLWCSSAHAEPIAVRVREAPTYGFLVLRTLEGTTLAQGELVQTVNRDRVENRLGFRFRDGSRYAEKVVFTQARTFALRTYHVSQRGPSFPTALDVTFDRASGRYTVRSQEKDDAAPKFLEGQMDFPADVYNGMTSLLIRNLPAGGRASVRAVAFTPKPRVLDVELVPVGDDPYYVAGEARRARRYRADLEVPGLLGIAAAAIGKEPPDLLYWIAGGPVPAFLKFEGPFYVNGPIWRIEVDSPRWK